MTVPTFPSRYGELRTLAGLLLVLTATLVTGWGNVQCGPNSVCGYGTRCDNVTSRCVCLSANSNLTKEGIPNSVFHCLRKRTRNNHFVFSLYQDEGVTRCRDQLCGYGAECYSGSCECSFSSGGKLTQTGYTSPSMWYCVEVCNEGSSSCPDNTTCTESLADSMYHCYCSAGATLSSTGQCLGHSTSTVKSTAHDITESASPTKLTTPEGAVTTKQSGPNNNQGDEKEDDSNPLVIGLTVGIGGAVLLAVVVLVAALALKHTRLKAGVDGVLQNELPAEFNHSYENAVSLSSPGVNTPSSRSIPTVDMPSLDDPANSSPNTYVNVSAPSESPYENVTSGLYESASTPDRSDSRLYTTLRQT